MIKITLNYKILYQVFELNCFEYSTLKMYTIQAVKIIVLIKTVLFYTCTKCYLQA